MAIASLQLIYWKYASGQWFVYSYQDQGFSWLHPHVRKYALSYSSGWLIYTPVMWLALIGFIPFLVKGSNRLAICLFTAIAYYLVSAWDVWWYSGMGGRAMVQYYAVLMFPMASLFELAMTRRWLLWLLVPLTMVFGYVNIWVTWHAHRGSLYDTDGGMSRAYYWRVIGRWTAPGDIVRLKDGPYMYRGNPPASARLVFVDSLEGGNLVMGGSRVLSEIYKLALPGGAGGHWLRASA